MYLFFVHLLKETISICIECSTHYKILECDFWWCTDCLVAEEILFEIFGNRRLTRPIPFKTFLNFPLNFKSISSKMSYIKNQLYAGIDRKPVKIEKNNFSYPIFTIQLTSNDINRIIIRGCEGLNIVTHSIFFSTTLDRVW